MGWSIKTQKTENFFTKRCKNLETVSNIYMKLKFSVHFILKGALNYEN